MYNRHKYKDSIKMGQAAELDFIKVAKTKGFTVVHSSIKEDMIGHWDFEISKTVGTNIKKRKIDVKAMKKVNRSDTQPTDKYYLIELNNVGGGLGWLYGAADGFAFQTNTSFLIVPKKELQSKVESLIDINGKSTPTHGNKIPYTIYDRIKYGNKDRFVYISKDDILDIENIRKWDL